MIIYKVFCKNFERKRGEPLGFLIERRKNLRGLSQIESGLRWAKLTFGSEVVDKQAIFVVPEELKLRDDASWPMEKAVFTKDEFSEMERLINHEEKSQTK